MFDEKKWQFDNIIEGQIDNEVAKAIEKAHSYHFNLQNYRSSLSDEQIKDWQETLKSVEIKNGSKIEKRYQELQKLALDSDRGAEPKVALQILASFDTKNALQMDIAREYLSKLDKKVLDKDDKLQKLEEILRKGFQYPDVPLSEILECYENKITIDEDKKYKQITVSNTGDVKLREIKLGSEIGTKSQVLIDLSQGDLLIYSRLGLHTGAIGLIPESLDDAVVTVDMPVFRYKAIEVNSKYVALVVQNQKFVDKVIEQNPTGAAQTRFHEDKFLQLQIPLPPLKVQNEIVEKIEKQKQIIEGAEKIYDNFCISADIFIGENKPIGNFITTLTDYHANGSYENLKENARLLDSPNYAVMIRTTDLENNNFETDLKYVDKESYDFLSKTQLFGGEIIITKIGSIGSVFLMSNLNKPATLGMNAFLIRVNDNITLNKYLFYWLITSEGKVKIIEKQLGVNAKTITKDAVRSIEVPLPSLETQRQIVEKLDKQMQALEGVRLLKSEAEKRIEEILAGVWGE